MVDDYCLTSSGKYFMDIQDENKLPNNKSIKGIAAGKAGEFNSHRMPNWVCLGRVGKFSLSK